MTQQRVTAPPTVYDREQLVALAREGHLIKLPSEAAWMAMSSADRQSLIAAVQAYGDELTRQKGREQ